MSDIQALIQKVQGIVQQKRLRLESAFRDADRLRHLRISSHAFYRGMKLVNLGLTQDEVGALARHFGTRDGSVLYKDFCDAVNAAFVPQGLLQNPTAHVKMPRNLSSGSKVRNALSPNDEDVLSVILLKIKTKARTEGTIVKNFFIDFDCTHTGIVTKNQFARGLKMLFPALFRSQDGEETALLIRAYQMGKYDVNYRNFCRDVSESSAKLERSDAEEKGDEDSRYEETADTPDVEDVVTAMRNDVISEGINIHPYFRIHDKMRSGFMHAGTFKSALKLAFPKIHMGEAILSGIVDRYIDRGKGLVNYRAFIEVVDAKTTSLKGLHLSPSKAVAKTRLSDTGKSRNPEVDINLIHRLRKTVSQRRPNLRLMFGNFDRMNRGVVTKSQFMRVIREELAKCNLSGDDLTHLADAFGKGYDSDYLKFISMVDVDNAPGADFVKSYESAPDEDWGESKHEREHTHGDVLAKLQRISKSRKVRFKDFLEDADRHRRREITRNQFISGLNRAAVSLQPSEFDALLAPYTTFGGMIRYFDFCKDVERAEVVPGLENNPTHEGKVAEIPFSDGNFELTPEEVEASDCVLEKIKRAVKNSRMLLAPSFKCFDKVNRGKLIPDRFRRAFDSLRLHWLSESDVQLLMKRFSESEGGVINYRAFVQSVDYKETHSTSEETIVDDYFGEEKAGEDDSGNLIQRLKDACWSRNVRIKDLLEDYDRLRKGIVPAGKFKSALSVSGLKLSSSDVAAVADLYSLPSDPGRIAYMPLVYLIDGGDDHMESRPTEVPSMRKSRNYAQRHPGTVDPRELKAVIDPMKKLLKLRPLILKNFFILKDKQNLRAVTVNQFLGVLKSNGLLDASGDVENTIRVLRQAYPAKHPEKMNYVKFCHDVDTL